MKKSVRMIAAVTAMSAAVAMTQISIAALAMEDSGRAVYGDETGAGEDPSGADEGLDAQISQNEAGGESEAASVAMPTETMHPAEPSGNMSTAEPMETAPATSPEEAASASESAGTASTVKPEESAPASEPTDTASTAKPGESVPTSEPTGTISITSPPEVTTTTKPTETVSSGSSEGAIPASEPVKTDPVSVTVPIYDYDIVDVVVPTSYALALNPHGLRIELGDGNVSEAQVISRNYGIINKSSQDKIVTVHLTMEDMNDGQIILVNSAQEAMNAEEGIYAIYLAAVPADAGEIRFGDAPADENTSAAALADVDMTKAENGAVALQMGENSFSFRLSRATYGFEGGNITLGDTASQGGMGQFKMTGLADDGSGVTAFTFDGAMNPRADWSRLSGGLRFSVVYTYQNATGDEKIIEGTGAMVESMMP